MNKKYIVVVQCDIVKQRCSGYLCEYAFNKRIDCFSQYKDQNELRFLSMTCGGCCGRATLRKLINLMNQLLKKENIKKEDIVVHLSSCVSFDSFHGPECPHKEYLSNLIKKKAGLDLVYGSRLSSKSEQLRNDGVYKPR